MYRVQKISLTLTKKYNGEYSKKTKELNMASFQCLVARVRVYILWVNETKRRGWAPTVGQTGPWLIVRTSASWSTEIYDTSCWPAVSGHDDAALSLSLSRYN